MYAFITGIVEEKGENVVVLNCNGVGYEIFASTNTLNSLPQVGEVSTVYTYLHVREDAFSLFGFSSKEEKSLFLELITVSGIGAKSAIQLLSGTSLNGLLTAIITGDVKLISSIKGIGKKTAERIVLELKGKLGDSNLQTLSVNDLQSSVNNNVTEQATELLTNMGLTRMEALNLVKSCYSADDTVEEVITKCLKNM